jgi:arsenate reductase
MKRSKPSAERRILFICTHNSARSQMAEGLANHYLRGRYNAKSAGTKPGRVNPYAISVMKELGVDISRARSKSIKEFEGQEFDFVVTVCSNAAEVCPFFPGKEHLHQGFKDPALATGTEEEMLRVFRSSRDQILAWIEAHFR